ncbi:MAG: hypothetical protein V2I54_05510 [Bacteroidales bacterium]|jgi:hypothetical protein|nr:hypothetical protein [Bacteroidales bacterium]
MKIYLKKIILFNLLLLIFFIFTKPALSQYKLKKIKEFKINTLFQVNLIDYDSQEGLYLGYTNKYSKGLEITIVNEEGEIIISKKMKGEGPEQYSSTLNCMSFSDEGDIWALTPHELLLYDKKLKLKKKNRYESKGRIYNYGGPKPFSYFYKNNEPIDFSFITNPTGSRKFAGVSNFKEKKLLHVSNIGKNDPYELVPVAERPQYEYLDESISGIYYPIYTVNKNESILYITTSLDDEITAINLNNNQIAAKIKINHEEFKILENNNITIKNLASYQNITLAAYNYKIFHFDDGLIALEYIREIPYGTYEKKIADNPKYHHFNDPDYHRLILFQNNKQLTKDLAIPYGKITMSLPDNSLLIKLENPEIEEDFIRYGIFKVTKE